MVQAAMLEPANQLQQAQADIDHLNARIHLLEQENRWLKQQLFGRSSEKRSAPVPANQSWLFNEAEAVTAAAEEVAQIAIPAHTRKAPGRKPIADNLPRVDIIHDLPEANGINSPSFLPIRSYHLTTTSANDTQAGAAASARLYSLVETAKANRLEPHAYLTHLFTHLPIATTVDEFEALLPWNVKTDSSIKSRASP
jgi:hypothetical protein